MKIFKFGGASVKDAEAVKNVAGILKQFPNDQIIVVLSAMGKMTNALERLMDAFYYQKGNAASVLEEIRRFHFDILEQLFPDKNHPIHTELHNTFIELEW